MQLITLNLWGGRAGNVIDAFFEKYRETDIFLLQEIFHHGTKRTVWHDDERPELFEELQALLPDHVGFFAPSVFDEWGLAIFVKRSLPIKQHGDAFVFKHRDSLEETDAASVGRNIQFLQTTIDNQPYTFLNFHGLWNGQGKGDSEDRREQSRQLIEFMKPLSGNIMIGGDFNLRPDTQSIHMLEEQLGLVNLITKHNVTSTRTSLYGKPEKFADYIFASPTIQVRDFRVLPEEVSDHAALHVAW